MAVLTTSRLILREMADADLDDMADLLGDENVMRYYPRPYTRSEAADWIAWNQRSYRDHGFGLWTMILRRTGEFVGDCGLTFQRVEGTAKLEVGPPRPGLVGFCGDGRRPACTASVRESPSRSLEHWPSRSAEAGGTSASTQRSVSGVRLQG